jgi:hypothetical protein
MRPCIALLLFCLPAVCAEKAAYDSNGRITAVLSDAGSVGVGSNLIAVLPGGKRVPLITRREGGGATRQGPDLVWSLALVLPDGGHGRATMKSEEDDAGLRYTVSVSAESSLELEALEFVLDLPRAPLVKGAVSADGAPAVPLSLVRAGGPVLYRGEAAALRATGPAGDLTLDLSFAPRAAISVVDRWDSGGRSYQVRAAVSRGPMAQGSAASLTTTIRLTNHPAAPAPARVTLDASPARVIASTDSAGITAGTISRPLPPTR